MAKILIIDDDPAIRVILRRYLEDADFKVLEASNGDEGLTRYHDTPCDLVITDILMPEKDGMEVIVELREQYEEVCILAISAGGRGLEASYNLSLAQVFGANDTLAKPFTRKKLVEVVENLLEKKCRSMRGKGRK